ncbi:MAG: hypothetical protein E6538_17090 [Paeniclostridium sordellii]|nr:hypothetical protein [Paeniclostridium sordellii]
MEVKHAMSLEEAKNEVTGLFSTSLDKTIHNNHIKVQDSEIDNISDEKVIYRKSENYIPEQTLIKNSIVHQDHKKILISEQLKFDIDNVEIPF